MFEFHYKFNGHTRANAEYINVNLEHDVKDAIGKVVYISKTEGITFSPCKE